MTRPPEIDPQELQVMLTAASETCLSVDPDKLNLQELKDYYSVRGRARGIGFDLKLVCSYVLQRLADNPPHHKITVALQRLRGVNIGNHVYIGHHVEIDSLYPQLVTIEDYVSIGTNCMIFAHSNPTCSVWLKLKKYSRFVAPVVIKKGAWIPPGTIILPGVTIGEHSVVGAGSVVNKDVAPFTMVAGSPARFIRSLL